MGRILTTVLWALGQARFFRVCAAGLAFAAMGAFFPAADSLGLVVRRGAAFFRGGAAFRSPSRSFSHFEILGANSA